MDCRAYLKYNQDMKSTIKKSTYLAIYRLLDRVSPVDFDCGTLCGAACCTSDFAPDDREYCAPSDENAGSYMGLYLLPGEEKIFTEEDDAWLQWGFIVAEEYEFPESWHGRIPFIQCRTAPDCNRKRRPIQCRTFPLSPHIDEDGIFRVILNTDDLPYVCPLVSEKITLNRGFIKATYTCWKHLIRDPYILDLVEMDSESRLESGSEIIFLYPDMQ